MTTSDTLGYALYRNQLSQGADDGTWYARILARGRVSEENLINDMLGKNSTITRQEVQAVLDLMFEVMKTRISEGYNVHTRIFRTNLSVKGVFESDRDEYDPARHRLRIHVTESADLKKFVGSRLNLEKSIAGERAPRVLSLYDFASDSTNGRLTPGNVARISGKNLYFDASDERQGVFFHGEETGVVIRGAEFRSVTGRNAMFMVPGDLAAGSYTAEVRCGFGSIIRSSELAGLLTVG